MPPKKRPTTRSQGSVKKPRQTARSQRAELRNLRAEDRRLIQDRMRELEARAEQSGDRRTLNRFMEASIARRVTLARRARDRANRAQAPPPQVEDDDDFTDSQISQLNRRFERLYDADLPFARFVQNNPFAAGSVENVRRERAYLMDWWDNQQLNERNQVVVNRAVNNTYRSIIDDSDSNARVRLDFQADPQGVMSTLRHLVRQVNRNPLGRFLIESEDSRSFYTLSANTVNDVLHLLGQEEEDRETHDSDPTLAALIQRGGVFYVSRPRPRYYFQAMQEEADEQDMPIDVNNEPNIEGFMQQRREQREREQRERRRQQRRSRRNRANGGFWAWTHKFDTERDKELCDILAEYGVYATVDPANYEENCLIKALIKHGGVPMPVIESLKACCRRSQIARLHLREIGNRNNINFIIHTMSNGEDDAEKCKVQKYGDPKGVEVELAIFQNHFFLYEKTSITGFALDHYPHHPKLNNVCTIGGEQKQFLKETWWSRHTNGKIDRSRGVLSTTLMRKLLENDMLTPIDKSNTHVYGTQFIKKVDYDFRTLEYPDWCAQRVHPPRFKPRDFQDKEEQALWKQVAEQRSIIWTQNSNLAPDILKHLDEQFEKYGLGAEEQLATLKKHRPYAQQVFFDFEATTDGDRHEPYMVAWSIFNGGESADVKSIVGRNCAMEMMEALADEFGTAVGPYPPSIQMIAHNVTYDAGWIMALLTKLKFTEKGLSIVQGNGIYTSKSTGKRIRVNFKDSMKMHPSSLSVYAASQGLQFGKELLPYHLLDSDLFDNKSGLMDYEEAVNRCMYKGGDLEQFKANLEKWGELEDDGQVDMVAYARQYCIIDVKLLHAAWCKSCKSSLEHLEMSQDAYPTQASLSHNRMIRVGVYDGVYQLAGVPQEFIKRCNVGGRVMLGWNQKVDTALLAATGEIEAPEVDDVDYNSLYPSSMAFGPGYPKGRPKVIPNGQQDLSAYDYYFVQVRFTKVGQPRKFPVVCMNENNEKGHQINQWTSDLVGKVRCVGKITLEDLVNFMDVEYEVMQGYYYDEGFNTTIHTVIKELYEQRMRLKRERNPGQQIVKLHMNSAYGKTGQKPVDTDVDYVSTRDLNAFMHNHYNVIKRMHIMPNGQMRVERYKSLIDQYNEIPVSCIVLEHSKHLMNKVMYCADEKYLHYTDTDSIQISSCHTKELVRRYKEKYGEELIGKGLGQMASDFEFARTFCMQNGKMVKTAVEPNGEIQGLRLIGVGKKSYICHLRDQAGQEVYHIRMKGVPGECIMDTCNEEYEGNPIKLYEELYKGEKVTFNLGKGSSVMFKTNLDHTVKSVVQPRIISF